MAKFDLKEYARKGAETRALELNAELAKIYRVFPELRSGKRGGATRGSASPSSRSRRKRKPMSAAQKRAVSLRMKRYWAERRKATGK